MNPRDTACRLTAQILRGLLEIIRRGKKKEEHRE